MGVLAIGTVVDEADRSGAEEVEVGPNNDGVDAAMRSRRRRLIEWMSVVRASDILFK